MSGTSIVFARGENPLRADKLNAAFSERLLRAGDTMTGMLKLATDPVLELDAVPKRYVDDQIGRLPLVDNTHTLQDDYAIDLGVGGIQYLPLTGGELSGALTGT